MWKSFALVYHAARRWSCTPTPSISTHPFLPLTRSLRTRAQRAATAPASHYASQKQALIASLDNALRPLKDLNRGFGTEFTGNTYAVDYGEDRGGLRLQFVDGEERLIVNTMKHGTGTYKYDAQQDEWVSPEDGHSLTEMLMRDIVYLCQGIPELG